MNMFDMRDLEELKILRKKADDLSGYSLATMVKNWGSYTKGPAISCTHQFMFDITASSLLKNAIKGQNTNLFKTEYKSLCDHYILLLEE